MKISWSRQALLDLRAIHEFIARDSEHYAGLVVQRIIERAEKASRMPTLGHPVHEHPQSGLREVHEGSHRIIYAFDDDHLHIITVVHMKQRMTRSRLRRTE